MLGNNDRPVICLHRLGEILPPQSNGHFADFEQILQNSDFNSLPMIDLQTGESLLRDEPCSEH